MVDLRALRARIDRQYASATPGSKGAVVIGLCDPTSELIAGYGALSADDPRPPTGDTVFEIGSVTKVLTGVALGEAVARGRLNLDDEAQLYLPTVRLPKHGDDPIRVVHLATYSSGLPWMPTNWIRVDSGTYTTEMWGTFLASYVLPYAPGAGFKYGNVGFGVLGDVLAEREGDSLGGLLSTRVFAPLGMRHSWLLDQRPANAEVAQGNDDKGQPVPLRFDKPLQAGCCAVESTAHDLLAFLRAHWDAKTPPPLKTAFALASTTYRKGEGDYGDRNVGLGWFIDPENGQLTKNGLMKGYRAAITLDRARRIGVVVLAADASFPAEALAGEALEGFVVERDRPAIPVVAALPVDATRASIEWESGLRLVGWSAPSHVRRGETVTLRYFYQASEPLDADYQVFVHGDVPGFRIRADHRTTRPTSDWPPHQIVEDRFTVKIPADHPGGAIRVWSGLYRQDRMKVRSIDDSDGHDRVRGPILNVEE